MGVNMYTVMIADDEPIVRKAMLSLTNWAELDCEVIYTAVNGTDVLENINRLSPDILITDIKMPGADGIEIAKYIMEQKLPIQVIILTAYADFSFAQAALKYNVIDYVTKTGAFEGIVQSIEKAKKMITENKGNRIETGKDSISHTLLKSVFDGSLYLASEIKSRLEKIQIVLQHYRVLYFYLQLEKSIDDERLTKIQYALNNFFCMVFGEEMLQSVSISRNRMALLLNSDTILQEEDIAKKCEQSVDMMDNFMKMNVYVGISNSFTEICDLKNAYDQGESIFENHFLDHLPKIVFFDQTEEIKNGFDEEIELLRKDIGLQVKKGNAAEALQSFRECLHIQDKQRFSANAVINVGVVIVNTCEHILGEYGNKLCEITEFPNNITKKIYSCHLQTEYQAIIETIIQKTSEFIWNSLNKKSSLVMECESYIEAHYFENITVGEIANAIGTSGSYLSRIFKEHTGNTIINTLNLAKLQKAEEYLSNTDMKIYEIADALGFENITYFYHFFKKHTGLSPKGYQTIHSGKSHSTPPEDEA